MGIRGPCSAVIVCLGLGGCASAPPPAGPAPSRALPTVEALLADYAAACAGPEGMDSCDPDHFEETFRDDLAGLRAHRDALVERWMRSLEAGDHAATYGLSWAGERRAIPLLRRGLLADRSFYGWESSDARTLEARMRDEQHPAQMARIAALERLGGAKVREVVALSSHERAALVREAFAAGDPGDPPDVARWLLLRLAPEALAARAVAPPAGPSAATVTPGLAGFVLAAHGFPHHDLAVLARVGEGRVEAAPQKVGCRVLPRASVTGTEPGRAAPITLGAKVFSNVANACLAEVDGLAKGDFVATIGLRAVAEPAALPPETQALLQGLALEALARVRGAEPADFVGEAEVFAVQYAGGVRAVVAARVARRAGVVPGNGGAENGGVESGGGVESEGGAEKGGGLGDAEKGGGAEKGERGSEGGVGSAGDDGREGGEWPARACVSRLCSVKPWSPDVPLASLVAVYDLGGQDAAPRERLVVASSGGGCGPEQEDVVRFTGFAAIEGAEPFVVVSRSACDGWEYELYAIDGTGARLVARGASGSRV